MNPETFSNFTPPGLELARNAFDYSVDAFQRSILFLDIMRKRGNNYIEHVKNGLPPVLVYDFEIVLDGREFTERPVNYALVRIIPDDGTNIDETKRPVVIIDPRAGHGPGIGGAKKDSEIGMALKDGRPTYFILFFPNPVPGQTLADVQRAEVIFMEEVARRHPKAEKPSMIGNCQAGWASALIGADRPDVYGAMVLAGSPLSYWSGVDGVNPMRYKGGLTGGVWLTSLWCDLGHGKFDGANLVAGFEDLNPANTFWTKEYNVFAKADTEEERYLDFEKWWGGFYYMNAEEIHFIVDSLFVGNKLEQGSLELSQDKRIDLRNLEDPVVVFASQGDNITPPQQALNWIAKVYGSADEIKRLQQVVVYMVHQQIGHLGIFVSSSVAKKEHKEIIGSVDQIQFLPPGLYEMVIEEDTQAGKPVKVRYEPREIEDIMALDDGTRDEEDFEPVAAVSQKLDKIYQTFLGPLVRQMVTEETAELIRQLHPLRVSRYSLSDLNPFMAPIKHLAPKVKENRRPVATDNPFMEMERLFSEQVKSSLNLYRDLRDIGMEALFKTIYGNPVVKSMFSEEKPVEPPQPETTTPQPENTEEITMTDQAIWTEMMDKGGFAEGIARIMVLMANADNSLDREEFLTAQKIRRSHKDLKGYTVAEFKDIVVTQSRILQTDLDMAIKTLAKLLPTDPERKEALEIAHKIAMADGVFADEEKLLINRIEKVLKIKPPRKRKPRKK